MADIGDFLLKALSQFAGGPGPPENNLVRFGLAAILWSSLLATAWSRRQRGSPARENLLVLGFGLVLFRELFKLGHLSFKLLTGTEHDLLCSLSAPLEHALTLLSVVLISGAFLQYILDNAPLVRRYLILGLGTTSLMLVATALWWPQQLLIEPSTRFHMTWPGSAIHLLGAGLIALAVVLMVRQRTWRHAVVGALTLLFVSEFLTFTNFATAHTYAALICPIGNAIYLIAIPLFGYVYYHEQQLEQQRAESALHTYRDHLEELVQERTSEITQANAHLQAEIGERRRTEQELARRNAELAVQNTLAATISESQGLDGVLQSALEHLLRMLDMEYGCVHLFDQTANKLVLHTQYSISATSAATCRSDLCGESAQAALADQQPIVRAYQLDSVVSASCPQTQLDYTLISTPLIAEGTAVGTLTIGATSVDPISPLPLKLLTTIGQQLGGVVEKAALHDQLELAATLEERQRIAAEMHDGLAQTLSYMGHTTDYARTLLEHGQLTDVQALFEQLRAAITQAGSEVRRSIASLQEKPTPRQSFQEAVRQTVAAAMPCATAQTQILLDDALPQLIFLPPPVQEQAIRVIQEALTNAQHHAAAQTIDVHLAGSLEQIAIQIQDDGCGFDLSIPPTDGRDHFGLSIMRARAARLGGALSVESTPGMGTSITLTVPLEATPRQSTNGSILKSRRLSSPV